MTRKFRISILRTQKQQSQSQQDSNLKRMRIHEILMFFLDDIARTELQIL